MDNTMEKIVSLCKRRGFIFQSSEIYGGIQGFWDYGPLGTELKRNVREAWYRDMVTNHDELFVPKGAPQAFQMVGIETSQIMHPQVWKCSGHYDLFHDMMVDCKECKSRFRADHLKVAAAIDAEKPIKCESYVTGMEEGGLSKTKHNSLAKASKTAEIVHFELPQYLKRLGPNPPEDLKPRCPLCSGQLTEPREFNLMFPTVIGALGTEEEDTAFLRPETAQGMFVNFKNVCDSSRVKMPFGIAQIGKSFRNEITPRNFTFRSREFEQMEMEFFCHPDESRKWYEYWRDRRYNWYVKLGITSDNSFCATTTPTNCRTTRSARPTWSMPSPSSKPASTASWRGSPIAATSTCARTWKASSIKDERLPGRRTGRQRPAEVPRQRQGSPIDDLLRRPRSRRTRAVPARRTATCRTSSSRPPGPTGRRWPSSARRTTKMNPRREGGEMQKRTVMRFHPRGWRRSRRPSFR
jgi:hypothetical protein